MVKASNYLLNIRNLVTIAIFIVVITTITFNNVKSHACENNAYSKECLTLNAISSGCIPNFQISASAEYKVINAQSCTKFKDYLADLDKSASKYSTPTLKLNKYLLAGIIQKESTWGQGGNAKGCSIIGDNGNGYGIAQMDKSFNPGMIQSGLGKKTTIQFGEESFRWDSCKESILYMGAYFRSIEDTGKKILVNKIAAAGINTKEDSNGFVDPKASKAYLQMILISYNAGLGGVTSKCTLKSDGYIDEGACNLYNPSGKYNYSTKVYEFMDDFFDCENNRRPVLGELEEANTQSGSSKKLEECMKKIRSTINASVNVPGNFNFSNLLRKYMSENTTHVSAPNGSDYGQCVSLVKHYQQFIGAKSDPVWFGPNKTTDIGPVQKWEAYQQGDKTGLDSNDKYEAMVVSDFNSLEVGDIILMNGSTRYGHTGIFINKTSDSFDLFDQWVIGGNKPPGKSTYNKSLFISAIRYIKK